MTSQKGDQETLRELSNLNPEACLNAIAGELKTRLNCETACILLWREVWGEEGNYEDRVLVTRYHSGMPESLLERNPVDPSDGEPVPEGRRPRKGYELYEYGEGITGGYIFESRQTIRAIIDLTGREVYDHQAKCAVTRSDINWRNMEEFGKASRCKDFKSLLGLPLLIKNQPIGVVKLINKLDDEKENELAEDGFSPTDLDRVRSFLSTIELVIESKTNEKQIQSLLAISQKVISADFKYDDLLQEIATSCAQTLNLRMCTIRLSDRGQLTFKANSFEPNQDGFAGTAQICDLVVDTKNAITFKCEGFCNFDDPDETYELLPPEAFGREVNSLIAVPVIYQEKAIGVIECYTFLAREFSTQDVNAVRAYASNLVATLFQRNRTKAAIASLVQSFSLLSSPEDVYTAMMGLVQEYLETRTVSLWEKQTIKEGFQFQLAQASERFASEYKSSKIQSLSDSSLTAKVANSNQIEHFNQKSLATQPLEHQKFIAEKGLHSLTIVPITIGGQAHAVIDVFYDHDRNLFREEADFLRLLAAKAASAIWSKKLTRSFQEISDTIVAEAEISLVLEKIAEIARGLLYAEPVILFQFDFGRGEFKPPKWSGELYKAIGMYAGKGKDNDFVNLMLNRSELYLESTAEYERFCLKGTVRPSKKDDFWHREKLESMAAIRLEDRQNQPVGVMFVNYRKPFIFDPLTKQVIKVFALQAASAMVRAGFPQMRNQELMALSLDQMLTDLLNDSASLIDAVNVPLLEYRDELETAESLVPRDGVQERIDAGLGFLGGFRDLHQKFMDFRTQAVVIPNYADFNLNNLVHAVLAFFEGRLGDVGIRIQPGYQKMANCVGYGSLVQEMLRQLILICLDAKPSNPSTLQINTFNAGKAAAIGIRLAEVGITEQDLDSILNRPLFVPERKGTPTRLGFCQEIARNHYGEVSVSLNRGRLTCRASIPLGPFAR